MGDYDSAILGRVNELQSMVLSLDRSLTVVGDRVEVVSQYQQEARSELATLRGDFHAFVRQAELTANIQRAETRLGALQGELEHQFGHHKVVRRTAIGVLQAFDIGLVSEDTVRSVGEQLMVQTPRYWLAPVLVALASWVGDDQEQCTRAVEEAFRRSPGRTSLFMALVLRRQGRRPSAVRWLRHYLNAQDPTVLGRDFAIILESISHGAFGPAGLSLATEILDRWREQLLVDDAIQQAQVARWRREIDAHRAPSAGGRFPRLATVAPQWPQMERVLSCAEAHQPLYDKYVALLAEEPAAVDRLEDAIDDILDRLVREYDPEELPLRRDLALNEAIIENGGDIEVSRRAVQDSSALETTLDYLTIQTTSALEPDAIGVSRATQRIAVASCHHWFAQAHATFTRDYRAALPAKVEAVFESSHGTGAQAFQLPKWTGSFTEPMEHLEQSLGAHWDRHAQPYIDGFAFDWRKKALIPATVVAVLLILVSICANIGLGLVVALVAGGIWGYLLYNQSVTAAQQQQDARNLVARARRESLTQLRAAGAEVTDWADRYTAADRLEPQVRGLIGDLGRAGHTASPYEQRTVFFGNGTGR